MFSCRYVSNVGISRRGDYKYVYAIQAYRALSCHFSGKRYMFSFKNEKVVGEIVKCYQDEGNSP